MNTRAERQDLVEARQAYDERAWQTAYDAFSRADAETPLEVTDVERLARCAALIGDTRAFLDLEERCYNLHLQAGAPLEAARGAFWVGFRSFSIGEGGRGSAWLGRCQRLVEAEGADHVLNGYLMLASIFAKLMGGKLEEAAETAARALEIGERFSDPDLIAMSQNLRGRALLQLGQRDDGLVLLDESMLSVLSDQLSPVFSGIIYCGVISACQRHYELERAREWTHALTNWCEAQPELVSFRGNCQVHRAEVFELSGEWQQALKQAKEAARPAEQSGARDVLADAHYQEAEIHRLRGEFELAEAAYEEACRLGKDAQPGLALLRLAQGNAEAARQGLSRALAEGTEPFRRSKLLAAAVEVHLAMGQVEAAHEAASELSDIATRFENEVLTALSARARGTVCLAEGDAQAALGPLRRAFFVWQRIGAPYFEARLQVELARACEALGDKEGAQLARVAARRVFEELGASVDLHALDADRTPRQTESAGPLSARELQVLRLVATGKTNKEVAVELDLSERTVDRHVGNIFKKLDVTTRAAATATAYERGWVKS